MFETRGSTIFRLHVQLNRFVIQTLEKMEETSKVSYVYSSITDKNVTLNCYACLHFEKKFTIIIILNV